MSFPKGPYKRHPWIEKTYGRGSQAQALYPVILALVLALALSGGCCVLANIVGG